MMKLQTIGCVALAIAVAGCFAPQAQAEETPSSIGDAMVRALFNDSGDIYRNRGIDRQATLLLGLSFPEHEHFNDAQAVNRLYQAAIRQRNSMGVVRTEDLPNPFSSSIRTNMVQSGAIGN
jgi:hypothetical protein